MHNCADRKCGLSNTRVVRQEREDVPERDLAVSHINPEDVVLNCFKMCDFQYIQPFMPTYSPTDRDCMIYEGSVREINTRKARSRQNTAAATTATLSDAEHIRPTAPIVQRNDAQSQQALNLIHENTAGVVTYSSNLRISRNLLERVRRTG